MSNQIILDKSGHVATMTLNQPEKLNALSSQLRNEMHVAIDEVKNDDQVRAVIVTGAGRGFCSGADLTGNREAAKRTQNEDLDDLGWVGHQALAMFNLNKPVIGAINGVAAGAGMSLALACDVRVGSEKTRFKTVFIERNLSPDSGMSFFLPRIIGYSRAADLIFTSRTVESDEAYRLGLLDRLVAHEQLLSVAHDLAEQMTQWPPLALRTSKRVLQHNQESEIDDAVRYELTSLAYGNRAESDHKESIAAFIEKRKPTYTGT